MSVEALSHAIRHLANGGSLTAEETAAAFDAVMRGDGSPAQVAALLVALRVKGETADELAGGARALRRAMVAIDVPNADALVDTCGTGGGALSTFNISTAAAFVAAGAGVRIAKHGNRSFTSRSGSADVLEALGIPVELSPTTLPDVLAQAGIVFMFAPTMHPAMRHVGAVRRELAITTAMNVLGPLANPARAGRQVIGVAEPARAPLMAGALAALGARHALVVHGEPGLDEISPLGCTRVFEVRDGTVTEWVLDPKSVGVHGGTPDELAGGTAADNARTIRAVLEGKQRGAGRAAVLLNAAGAIYVSGTAPSFEAALGRAERALEAGEGLRVLEKLRRASDRAAQRKEPS